MNHTIGKLRSSVLLASTGIALALLIAGGCASYTIVPPTSHPAVTGDNVALYQNRPKKYEILGIVTLPITPDYHWDSNGNCDPGYDALKTMAGQLGANGLLLSMDPGEYDAMVTTGYHNVFYNVAMRVNPKRAVATAIYVIEQ